MSNESKGVSVIDAVANLITQKIYDAILLLSNTIKYVSKSSSQVKAKSRVRDHGEVFTNEREVNSMLDLVKNETLRIDSRFFEPACGDGNFLIEILNRKLSVVAEKYKHNKTDMEKYSLLALTSIYGIDILLDNIKECRGRLYNYLEEFFDTNNINFTDDLKKSAKFILTKNIVQGDALTMKTLKDKRIIFSEWTIIKFTYMQRRDFYLDNLLNSPLKVKDIVKNKPIYSKNNENNSNHDVEFINSKITNYRKVYE